jgi:NAD(P)-dependent dehydrogenase (short-subunit alcohol dehydrogenase family)
MQVDVTAEKSVTRAMEHMVQTFGRIDYCVNCAGVSRNNETRFSIPPSLHRRVFHVRVSG